MNSILLFVFLSVAGCFSANASDGCLPYSDANDAKGVRRDTVEKSMAFYTIDSLEREGWFFSDIIWDETLGKCVITFKRPDKGSTHEEEAPVFLSADELTRIDNSYDLKQAVEENWPNFGDNRTGVWEGWSLRGEKKLYYIFKDGYMVKVICNGKVVEGMHDYSPYL